MITDTTLSGALDEALDRIHTKGEEWHGGLTSHAPMVAEALDFAGRAHAIGPWIDGYLGRLADPMPETEPIDPARWRLRLGHHASTADWAAFFRREIADHGWAATVATWVPRFVPGVITAATHGVIRTSHAVRALDRADTGPRREELARALGYWAASYATLPPVMPQGDLPFADALALVPMVPDRDRTDWLISDRVGRIDADRFAAAIRAAARPADAVAGAVEVAALGRRLLAAVPSAEIAFTHAVTAPASLLALAPHLAPHVATAAVGEAFKAAAALWAGYGTAPLAVDPGAVPVPDIDAAIADGDEHRIKLAVAVHALTLGP